MLLTYLLTHSMVQSRYWAANWFAACQEIPRISRNPKDHYRTHKRPPPVSILGQPNPVHIPTSHLLEIQLNIIHPSTPTFLYLSSTLRGVKLMSHCGKKIRDSWVYLRTDVCREYVELTFLHLSSTYSPQTSVRKYPQEFRIIFPQCDINFTPRKVKNKTLNFLHINTLCHIPPITSIITLRSSKLSAWDIRYNWLNR